MTDKTIKHAERFIYEQMEAFGGPSYYVHDTIKDQQVCRTFDEIRAKHITKALNIYNVMQNSGSGIHAMNPETLETIKTHDL